MPCAGETFPATTVRLRPGLAPLWRDDRTVQVGLDPRRALVASGISPAPAQPAPGAEAGGTQLLAPGALATWLDQAGVLDSSPPAADPRPEFDPATTARFAPESAVIGLTHPHPGTTAAVLAGRRRARALVLGGGRVGAAVAHLLAASGLGRVMIEHDGIVQAADACPGGLSPADIGLRYSAAVTALTVRALPPALPAGPPDIAVLAHDRPGPYPPRSWRGLRAQGVTLLPVEVREGTVVVGPMSIAGRPGCPACLDRHRTDRDPCWPALSAQLALARGWLASTAGVVQVWAAAAAAAAELLEHLDGRSLSGDGAATEPGFAGWSAATGPVTARGYSLELDPPGWSWHRRFWGPHPECSCSSQGGAPDQGG